MLLELSMIIVGAHYWDQGLNLGTTFVLMPKFDPVNALKAIDEHKVSRTLGIFAAHAEV